MTDADRDSEEQVEMAIAPAMTSRSIDWYAEGESRTVEIGGVVVTVRFVGRKGRRGRIAIEAPAGAAFRQGQDPESTRPDDAGSGERCEKRCDGSVVS